MSFTTSSLNLLFVLTALASEAFGATCAKVAENQTATLSCPSGQVVSSVDFASYGNPRGSCGSYSIRTCNAATSKTIVQNLCLGKASCKVPASNGTFGDPCSGVSKSLAVQVKCAVAPTASDPNWVRCATESGSCNFSGTRNVRYGANGSYITKSAVTGPVACTNSNFGNDPAYGVTKTCDYSASVVTPPPAPAPTPAPTPTQPQGSTMVPPAPIAVPADALNIPTNIANGATVSLLCGRAYRGTLELSGKSNITVNTSGTCGKATILPAAGQSGINAVGSNTIQINGIKIQGSARGINVNNAQSVTIQNVDILKSSDSGIYASGIVGLNLSNSTISDSGNTGIDGGSWVVKGTVVNTTITRSGANGGNYNGVGIYFGDGHDNRIDHVTVTNSVYHGIVVLHNSFTTVSQSVVDASCTGPDHDCGAIYTGARDRLPLTLRIENNLVSNSGGIGIYLDDSSNGVVVTGNSVTKTENGMTLHNAFNNQITANKVFANRVTHIRFGQDVAGAVYGNSIQQNTFQSTSSEKTFNLETGDIRGFSAFDYNSYNGNPSIFARSWDGVHNGVDYTYSAWKTYMNQDAHSLFNGQP